MSGSGEAGNLQAEPDGTWLEATGIHLLHRSSMRAEALRYALAGALVLVAAAALILLPRAGPAAEDASEVESAVLVDLPPALASSAPERDAADGPEQRASPASAATSAPPPVDVPTPDHDPTPPVPEQPPIDTPPPAPDPAAVLEERKIEVPPPQPATAAAPQQEEQAPAGSQQPVRTPDAAGEDDQPHASARAMSLWQRSMVSRLETSKHALRREAGRQGTVIVAFAISRAGALVSARVTRGSGDAALDAVAKTLVERAAPFPAPPNGVGEKDLSFTVPIRFKR